MADTFYKNPTGGLVNTQFADKSLQGGATYDIGGNTVALTTPDTSTITPTNINPNTPAVNIPQTPVSNTPNAVIANAETATNPYQDLINQQNKTLNDTGADKNSSRSLVTSLMEKLGGQKAREGQLNQENGLPDRVQQYNQYTNDINSLTASTAKQIQDIAKGSLGPISAEAAQGKANEIRRDNAYEITMKEIARSTAGNDITRLQSSIKNQLDIEFGPVKAQLETAKFLYDDLKDTWSKAEQRQFELQYQSKKEEVARKEKDKEAVGDIIEKALNNGVALPANIAEQMMRDGTKQGALSILTKNGTNLGGLEARYKEAQIANIYQNIAESKAKTNPQTGEKAVSESLSRVNDINTVLQNPNFDKAFGVSGLYSSFIPGSPAVTVKAQVQQVIDSAALAARGQLKGQGAVSDFEGQMLKNAQTELKFAQNANDAKQALIKVRGAITTSSGGSAPVIITDKKGVAKTGMADSSIINEAIKNGYTVTYQ